MYFRKTVIVTGKKEGKDKKNVKKVKIALCRLGSAWDTLGL